MEEAAAVRRAASESVADVAPEELRRTIDEYVADGSVVPGVLTLLSARAVTDEHPEDLVEQAAGVQLIYDGLRLTRDLAQDDPWNGGDRDAANMAILAADVLVARGFYLLARTDAAEDAVGVVRAFGRDQTVRESAAPRPSSRSRREPRNGRTRTRHPHRRLGLRRPNRRCRRSRRRFRAR
ncbi:hypothetical protein [Natronomonas sp. CBA1123]|uniref:DUF7114 family protein n=1 Tax=Natronomonas sp. CBA1123 TaxID=2668070 RepID=UPI001E61B9B2|nr:hypothetical protein [Natronomonas sp. CBA1123]